MLKRFKLWLLSATIEYHWLFIKHERKIGTQMLNQGVKVNCPKMLLLSNHLNRHILRAETARKQYEALVKACLVVYSATAETTQQQEFAICNNENGEESKSYIMDSWLTQALNHHM